MDREMNQGEAATLQGNHVKRNSLIVIVSSLVLLQAVRYGLKSLAFLFVEPTSFNDRMVSLAVMLMLSAVIILLASAGHHSLCLFPEKFTWFHWAEFSVYVVMLAVSMAVLEKFNVPDCMLLVYSAVVIPLFEELVFRSLVWNRLETAFSNEWAVYLLSSVLFGLWHIGYLDSYMLRASSNLLTIVFNKVLLGLGFGLVLGLVRIKTGKVLPAILLHGILNLLGR